MSYGNVNKILLVGNLGADPELRHTPKGHPVLTLRVATNHGIKNPDGTFREETSWHRAVVFGKRAESCARYLTKGCRVFVQGELRMKAYVDKEGNPRKSAEIFVDDVQLLGVARREGFHPPEADTETESEPAALVH